MKAIAATSSGLLLATIYNQSQLAERKHVACYWSINTAVTAVPLIAHPLSLRWQWGYFYGRYDTTPMCESYCQIPFVFGVYFVWFPL